MKSIIAPAERERKNRLCTWSSSSGIKRATLGAKQARRTHPKKRDNKNHSNKTEEKTMAQTSHCDIFVYTKYNIYFALHGEILCPFRPRIYLFYSFVFVSRGAAVVIATAVVFRWPKMCIFVCWLFRWFPIHFFTSWRCFSCFECSV